MREGTEDRPGQNHKINPSKKQKGNNGDAAQIFD